MNKLQVWWSGRSPAEKWGLGIVGGVVVVATGGAAAYAVSTGGALVMVGETVVVAIGAAAPVLAKGIGAG